MALQPVVDFRAASFFETFKGRCPHVQQFPVFILPREQSTPEQLDSTPAIYRFHADDEAISTFIGPRMVAANMRKWTGYPEYRSFVLEVIECYLSLMWEPEIERHSLGFYNRIPVDGIEELREIVDVPFDVRGEVSFYELLVQSSRTTEAGSVLTQLIVRPPDAITREPYLAINNIIRSDEVKGRFENLDRFAEWLDRAHEVGREAFWSVLSEKARASWKKSTD
jgi:uncharacterized protein (TIGR04255 family)